MVDNNDKGRRKRRSMPPFIPLGECIEVLEDAYRRGGTSHFTKAVLSQYLKMTTKSTSFIRRIAAFRQFGLIEGTGDTVILSPTAMSIIAPQSDRERMEAKLRAFESVDVFRRLKEKHQGGLLPGREYMINEFIRNYSMDSEAAGLWVDCYCRSAEVAGIFSSRPDGTTLVLAKPYEEKRPIPHVVEEVAQEQEPHPVIETTQLVEKPTKVEIPSERWSIPIPIEGEEEVEAYLDLPYKRITEEQVDRLFESIEALKPYLKLISKKKDVGGKQQDWDE